MATLLNVAPQEKITARLAACAALWLWAIIDWAAGFWLMVAGYDDRMVGRVLNTTGAVGFLMMVVGLAMFLWGFQVGVWAVELFRRKEGLAARLQRMVLPILWLGISGIAAGLAFWIYAKILGKFSIRAWIFLALPVVGLIVLLAVTQGVLRWAGREESQGATRGN